MLHCALFAGAGAAERLPDDYLVDVVKGCCGRRLFEGYAREQRHTLMADLLPVCSRGAHCNRNACVAGTSARGVVMCVLTAHPRVAGLHSLAMQLSEHISFSGSPCLVDGAV